VGLEVAPPAPGMVFQLAPELGAQGQAGDERNTNPPGSGRATWKNQARFP
jgi:hypothetical protein